jgi:Domain of unknown function (DUF4062)
MDKRYQVFVSSTYRDLIEERAEVMQALLELDCVPSGMELFPAADDTQWGWIKKVIAESDYYIVILGGRYGSISNATGLSFTEMEYRFALEIGKPVIAFLHEDPSKLPSGRCEQEPDSIKKLKGFRNLVEEKLCKHWSSAPDLGAKVSRGVTQLIKQRPAVGWVRADQVPTNQNAEDILKLKRKNEQLEAELQKARTEKPTDTDWLASGKDLSTLSFTFTRKKRQDTAGKNPWKSVGTGKAEVKVSWDDIFGFLAPTMMTDVNRWELQERLNAFVQQFGKRIAEQQHTGERLTRFELDPDSSLRVIIQLKALKLIATSAGGGPEQWSLAPYGENYMARLLAAPKPKHSK